MATNTTTSLSNQYQRYFSKQLLDHAVNTLVLNQFGKQADLPKGMGSKEIRFFRPVVAASSNVQTLTEGTPISTFTDLTYEAVDVTLEQIGEAMKFTDILGWTALLNVLKDGITLMGEDCSLKADDMTLAAIQTGSPTKRYSGGAATFNALVALSDANGKFTASDALDSMTNLQINKAPRIQGEYIGIVPPQIARDLMRDTDWLEASKYSSVKQLFKGEIGSLYGVRFILTTNDWAEANTNGTEGTRVTANKKIYSSFFTGREGYGVVKLSGSSPMKPQVIINDKPDKADPLNQTIVAGWKAFYQAKLLNPSWVVVNRSKSQYV
jgi:N4-gp56 family major capsid protein